MIYIASLHRRTWSCLWIFNTTWNILGWNSLRDAFLQKHIWELQCSVFASIFTSLFKSFSWSSLYRRREIFYLFALALYNFRWFCSILCHNSNPLSFQCSQPLYIPLHFSFSSFQRRFMKRAGRKPGMAIASHRKSHRIPRFFQKNIASNYRIKTTKKNRIRYRIAEFDKKNFSIFSIISIFCL